MLATAALILSTAAQPAPAETFAPTPDFAPAHPFVFMTPEDVQVLRENVNVKKLPWAVALYDQAKADADANPPVLKTDETLFATTTYGKHMLAATLVYLASDDPHYGDLAVDWLMTYANAGVTYTSYDSLAKLSGIHMVFAWVYDLMYGYMQANRPADLAKTTSWLNYYMRSLYGSFKINTDFNGICSKAVMAYVLGKGAVIDDVASQFRTFYESMPGGYYGDFWSGQAFKNYDITLECLMTYAMATHHAAERGYSSFDALTWKTSKGFNLVQDHWRTMVKYSTPRFQVPFQSIWRGPLFWIPNGTAVPQELYAVTHDPELGTIVAANPGRALDAQAIDGNWETIDPWPGLTHGREVDNATGIRNDSFDNTGRGFAVMLSGDPRGVETPDELHAYLMHGSYGAVEPLNLKLYGKGQKLTQEHDTAPYDTYGERGSGGIYVRPVAKQNLPADNTVPDSSDILLWDVTPDVKIIAADYHGLGGTVLPNYHRRTVAVTSDYFFDLYDANDSGTTPFTYVVDGVGPDSSSVRVNGQDLASPQHVPTSGDVTATWPNHMKLTMLNNAASDVTMFKSSDLPPALPYATDPMHVLQVRRSVAGPARFEAVIEPLGQGGSPAITSIDRLAGGPGDIVAVKVSAARYTDYLAYAETLGASTVGGGAQTFALDGRYGYVRFDKVSGSLRVSGSISSFTLPAAGAVRVCVNGKPESFLRDGDSVTWPGTGSGSLDPTPCEFPIDAVAPSPPSDLAATGSTETSISAAWTPSTDNVEVAGYGLYLDGRKIGESPTASATFDGLSCGTTHTLGIDAVDPATNRSAIVRVTASTVDCDVTRPTVSLLQPPGGSSVSGATLVTATAADDRRVAGVQFELDGAPLDVEDTEAPYEILWDSTHAPDGVHTLTAVARDGAGNTATSEPVTVTVANGPSIAFVQDLGTATAGNTGASISLTVGLRGVSAGDTVVLWAGMSSRGITIASVTDSRGNEYTVDATVNHPTQSLNTFVASGYVATPLSPGDHITVTFSRSTYSARLLAGAEFSGIAPVLRVDQQAAGSGWNATPISPATSPTAQPDELVVNGFGTDTTALFTPASGFTALGSATASPSGVTRTIHQAFRIVGDAAAYRATASMSGPGFWTAAVVTYRPAPVSPASVDPPAVYGAAQVDATLFASTGTWAGTAPIAYAYQWRRCDASGAACADIAGATDSIYTVAPEDSGSTLRVAVTASNAAGSSSTASGPTTVVGSGPASVVPYVAPARVSSVTSSGATVSWSTDVPSSSAVEYGLGPSYGLWTAEDTTASKTHSVVLTGLLPATTYHVRALSRSGAGTGAGADATLTTLPLDGTARVSTAGGTAFLLDGRPFFPLMQWLQCPSTIAANVALGINTFMGKGCTNSDQDQLAQLRQRNALGVLPFASAVGSDPALAGWHFVDEPDLKQTLPSTIKSQYDANRAADPNHLNFLTLTARFFSKLSAPAWMAGNRDYYGQYAAATDAVGFDLYPVTGFCRPDWIPWVADAQRELTTTYAPGKPTYQWIEATSTSSTACAGRGVLPEELRAEVWMAIANGATGIGYFTHSWTPTYSQFRVSPEVQAEMARTNRQVATLAPALLGTAAAVDHTDLLGGRVDVLARRHHGALYLFAVNVGSADERVRFSAPELAGRSVRVFEEGRTIPADASGTFEDAFAPLAVHVYVVPPA